MPKKTRKMKQRAAERRGIQVAPVEGGAMSGMPSTGAPTRSRSDPAVVRVASPLTYDYSYIYGDLRRIAVFAAIAFVVLIALSFIIK